MARNGSGVYTLPESAFVFDTVISETAVNSNFSDIATALTNSLAANGETTVTANLPMNSKKHTGLAVGTANADSVTLGQVQNGGMNYIASDTGSANAYVIAPSPAITAYVAGQKFEFVAANASTGASTLNVSGLGTKAIEYQGAALGGAEIKAGATIVVEYDGTAWQMVSPSDLGGDMLRADNLSNVGSAATARTNLGVEIGVDVQAFDADTAKTDVAQEYTKTQNFNEAALTSTSNSVAWVASSNQVVTHILTENTTFAAPSAQVAGAFYSLKIVQHASAAKTVAYNAVFKFEGGVTPTMTTTLSGVDVMTFRSDGTNMYMVGIVQDLS